MTRKTAVYSTVRYNKYYETFSFSFFYRQNKIFIDDLVNKRVGVKYCPFKAPSTHCIVIMAESKRAKDSVLWRNLRKVYLYEEEEKDSALQAVQRCAQEAFATALDDPRRTMMLANDILEMRHRQHGNSCINNKPQSSSMDFFDGDSHSSYLSLERGFLRGSKRALFEENENRHKPVHNAGSSFSVDGSYDLDLTTETGTRLSTLSGNKKKRLNKNSTHKQKKLSFLSIETLSQIRARNNFSQISKEAWMCGICAKSFSSFEAAKKHEDYHIKEVVMDLGWVCNTPGRPNSLESSMNIHLASFSTPHESAVQDNLQDHQIHRQEFHTVQPKITNALAPSMKQGSATPLRPDVLTMSKTNRTSMPRQHQTPSKTSIKKSIGPDLAGIDEVSYEAINDHGDWAEYDLLVPHGMRDYTVLADEALIDVCNKAQGLVLNQLEQEAEFELECYSKDKQYYDTLEQRELERQRDGAYSRFRTEGKNIAEKIQNKFVDAYALMKEGKSRKATSTVDYYKRRLKGDTDVHNVIENTKHTLYVNVIVKNSLQVVRYELERLAKQRWEEYKAKNSDNQAIVDSRNTESRAQFEKFKAAAQGNLVKLAGLALASDFTPRRIAVQLSNDLYRYVPSSSNYTLGERHCREYLHVVSALLHRLLTPRLKRRGVFIETEIEYRVGPYFVLAVNVLRVDWGRLVRMTNRDVSERRAKWRKEIENEETNLGFSRYFGPFASVVRLSRMTSMEILANFLAVLYYTHWVIYTPICFLLYTFVMGETFRKYFLSSVTDGEYFWLAKKDPI
jgi:hypothetical protein